MIRLRTTILILLSTPAALILSCDEALPPREKIPTVLAGQLRILGAGQVLDVVGGEPVGLGGAIQIQVANVYTEVLQDTASLEGRAEVWLKDHPDVRGSFTFGSRDLTSLSVLQGSVLTLGVGSSCTLIKQWSHRTEDSIPMWEYVNLFPDTTPKGEPFCRSAPVTYVIRCALRVFKSVGQIQFDDQEFTLTYHVYGAQCPLAP